MFRSKFKNVAYGITVNLAEDVNQRGLGLVCLHETDEIVEGIKLIPNGNVNFSITKEELTKKIENKEYIFLETIPRTIAKELRNVFEMNKLQSSNKNVS